MSPEFISTLLSGGIGAAIITGIAALFRWYRDRAELSVTRKYTDADQVRAVLEEQTEQQQARISQLENSQALINAAKDSEIQGLKAEVLHERSEVALCRKQHAEAALQAAVMNERVESFGRLMEEAKLTIEENRDHIADLQQEIKNMKWLMGERRVVRPGEPTPP